MSVKKRNGSRKKPVQQNQEPSLRKLKTSNHAQKFYSDCIRESELTICTGPAGTGKTYLATYVALEKLLDGYVDRIVITRPVVEAGEKLGFLPGTLEEKINPYLLPILDSFEDHVGTQTVKDLIDGGAIEIAPLAFMRGRTFNHSFVILDEAENTTKEQMKMFLTRYGNGSVFVVNGDETQSDLKNKEENGLEWANRKLRPSERIAKVEFARSDIVRSALVAEILGQLDVPDSPED